MESDSLFPFTPTWSAAETSEEEEDVLFPTISLIPLLAWEDASLYADRPLNLNAFQDLEEQLWPIAFAPLSLPLEEPKIELFISGELAERTLIQTDIRLLQTQPLSFRPPLFVTYQVELDERVGEIFWYERTQASGRKEVDELTEDILLNLRFSTEYRQMAGGVLHFKIGDAKE